MSKKIYSTNDAFKIIREAYKIANMENMNKNSFDKSIKTIKDIKKLENARILPVNKSIKLINEIGKFISIHLANLISTVNYQNKSNIYKKLFILMSYDSNFSRNYITNTNTRYVISWIIIYLRNELNRKEKNNNVQTRKITKLTPGKYKITKNRIINKNNNVQQNKKRTRTRTRTLSSNTPGKYEITMNGFTRKNNNNV